MLLAALGSLAGPAAAAVPSLEAETMRLHRGKVVEDAGASGGSFVALRGKGIAEIDVVTGHVSRLTVHVRRERCERRTADPRFVLTVDGRRAMIRTVGAHGWRRRSAVARLTAGRHTLRLRVRPRGSRRCDARLQLDKIELAQRPGPIAVPLPSPAPAPAPAPSPTPQPDKPAAPETTPSAEETPPAEETAPPEDTPPPAGTTPPGDVPPAFVGDFETGNLSQWTNVQGQAPDRNAVVSAPVRQGRFASRHEVRDGDMVAMGERAELLWGTSASPTLHEGEEHYIGWSTFFPSEFPATLGRQLFMQTHPQGGGFPPIEMRCDGGRISIDLVAGAVPWSAPLVRGMWHDFVLRARWSADPAVGFVELWHNGTKVLSNHRVQTLEQPGFDSYLKLGYYRPGVVEQPPAFVHHDAMRVGTTYESVAP